MSGVVTFRGHWIDGICVFIRSSRASVVVLSTFIMDFVLLALMLAGVLRWSNSRGKGGIWWLLYTQASLHRIIDNAWSFNLMAHAVY